MPPFLRAIIDQSAAEVAANRLDGPAAAAERRCAASPMGCGQSLASVRPFRDRESRAEYDVTHLCQSCRDVIWAYSPEQIAEMAADPENYGRCGECGEYREYERVDVGIGVMKGFDCCFGPGIPRCTRTSGCWLGVDHVHECAL